MGRRTWNRNVDWRIYCRNSQFPDGLFIWSYADCGVPFLLPVQGRPTFPQKQTPVILFFVSKDKDVRQLIAHLCDLYRKNKRAEQINMIFNKQR